MTDLMLIGEAFGREEEEVGRPFVGPSGKLLRGLLRQIGVPFESCYVTNVFNLRPKPTNDIGNLCGSKADGIPDMPYLQKGKYVAAKYAPELSRLLNEIEMQNPRCIVALGATPAWALLRTSGIKAIRGAPTLGRTGHKVLPTYHPAAVLRDYSLKPILLADLMKAKEESAFADVRRPKRFIWTWPTLDDIRQFIREFIDPLPDLSIDIETKGDTITCIGFAPRRDIALVIPFYNPEEPDGNYWRTIEDELAVWEFVRYICGLRKRIVFQNGLYDMNFLWSRMGIRVPYASDDTMLLHHALQPEMEKGLGFLGSIYTNEASWKFMRHSDTIKKED